MSKWEVKGLATVSNYGLLEMLPKDKVQFAAEIKVLSTKGDVVRLIASAYDPKKEEEEQRTLRQNRYYHKLLDIICDHTGDYHKDMHRELKIKILGRPYIYKDREVIEVPSTRDLTTKTFGDYLERVFQFASEEFGLVLPEPNTI